MSKNEKHIAAIVFCFVLFILFLPLCIGVYFEGQVNLAKVRCESTYDKK